MATLVPCAGVYSSLPNPSPNLKLFMAMERTTATTLHSRLLKTSSKMQLPAIWYRRARIVMTTGGSKTAGVAMMIGIRIILIHFGELTAIPYIVGRESTDWIFQETNRRAQVDACRIFQPLQFPLLEKSRKGSPQKS